MRLLRWIARTLRDWFVAEKCTCIALPPKFGNANHVILRDPFCASPDCIFQERVKA